MEYPKIENLWRRDMDRNGLVIEGEYSLPEFKNVVMYDVTEKIDGMNIRIEYVSESFDHDFALSFKGRTENAQIPKALLGHLDAIFSREFFAVNFPNANSVTIYGEGYGSGIRNGGLYRNDVSFIAFDIIIDDWWLQYDDVFKILFKARIPVVPHLGCRTIQEIVEFVKEYPLSILAGGRGEMEGVVARSYPLMLFRNKKPLMFKLKCEDYKRLEEL